MNDLADFLLARIAEDEAVARGIVGTLYWKKPGTGEAPADGEHIGRWNPERVLAECEAKRRIVEVEPDCGFDRFQRVAWDDCHEMALRALALPYADHPDYDESWRP